MNTTPILRATNIVKKLGGKTILNDVSLDVHKGDVKVVIGPSGAGKSTLVRCINMLERPTAGSVVIDGKDLTKMTEKELRAERQSITMIFQGFNLLMQKNCLRNVCFPLELAGVKKAEAIKKAQSLLELVGLGDKASAYPAQLSGGQQQRVAIARALATNPKVLLCDEATSALDPKTTNAILELIREINQKLGITVIIITHQMSVVESTCRHVAILEEGQVVEQGEVSAVFSHPKSEAARRLVFPEGNPESLLCSLPGSRLIRVVFNGADATGKPIIARMATEIGVEANIAYASTRSIEGRAYGSMLLSIEDKNDDLARAIGYLTQDGDITAQEVTQYAE